MKRLFLSLLILLPAVSFAQSTITIGPKAGVAYSFITGGDQPKDQKFYTGFEAGGFITISGNSHLGFTGELLYAQKGTKVEESENGATGTQTVKYSYIAIPLLFRYFAGNEGSKVRPNVYIGPSLNFLMSAKSKADVSYMGQSQTFESDGKDVTPAFDFGAVVGVGVNIKTGNRQWFNIDVRYNQSVTKASKSGDVSTTIGGQTLTNTTPEQNFYHGGILLNLGYGFGI